MRKHKLTKIYSLRENPTPSQQSRMGQCERQARQYLFILDKTMPLFRKVWRANNFGYLRFDTVYALRFHVEGTKFTGFVIIAGMSDFVQIAFQNEAGEILDEMGKDFGGTWNYPDLADTIDHAVAPIREDELFDIEQVRRVMPKIYEALIEIDEVRRGNRGFEVSEVTESDELMLDDASSLLTYFYFDGYIGHLRDPESTIYEKQLLKTVAYIIEHKDSKLASELVGPNLDLHAIKEFINEYEDLVDMFSENMDSTKKDEAVKSGKVKVEKKDYDMNAGSIPANYESYYEYGDSCRYNYPDTGYQLPWVCRAIDEIFVFRQVLLRFLRYYPVKD